MEALALLFGRDRLLRTLTEYDFYGGDPQPADRIRLIATIVGFSPNDFTHHSDWFGVHRGVPKWYDAATGELHEKPDDPNWLVACQVAYCARFDRQLLEVSSLRYFHHDDEAPDAFADESSISTFPGQLVRELGFLLAPASRTWDRIISFGSELFKRVVTTASAKPSNSVIAARDSLREPRHPLEDDENLETLVKNLNSELSGFFLEKPNLRLRLTTTDSEGVLDAVVPHYSAEGEKLVLPARRHGNGLISLQWLLLLLELGRKRAEQGLPFLMALEEPELHVPPPLQRRLVHRIQALSAQTFVSTHSPIVAAMADPRTLTLLRNDGGALHAVPLHVETPADATPSTMRALFYLRRLDTIAALMHESVLVPEGDTDFFLLQLLARAVDVGGTWGRESDCHFGTYVGLIPTKDAAVVATAERMIELHPRVSAIVDGDKAGKGYAKALSALADPPMCIARWKDDWTIEDVVGWILEGDAANAFTAIAPNILPAPGSIAELVTRLKSSERASGGLKGDQMIYEIIADVISTTEGARVRSRKVLNALTALACGDSTPLFSAKDPNDPNVRVFTP